jgi:dCTP deaminase
MILSGLEIKRQMRLGNIVISPFDEACVNPNSYNLKLHDELLVYTDDVLDMKKSLDTERITIPPDGFVLQPGRLYLGRTHERTATNSFVPMLEGRSSIGRLRLVYSCDGRRSGTSVFRLLDA